MIVGTGIDIVSIDRIQKACNNKAFISRILTGKEEFLDICHFAGLWAAKEAVFKALGTGLGPLGFSDIEVAQEHSGAPRVFLSEKAQQRLGAIGGKMVWITISHEKEYAVAQAIAEG